MEGTCMELALEGERLCKAGDCRTGVQFFEAAVGVGTDDLKTLSAIYSQLGNAYFYLQEYGKALEYHKHDLNLARTLGDKLGEAKASGNLGNTLKVLGKFDEAIACCERHLDISRELGDKIGEARALYNLGNVYHAKGKHAGRSAQQDPGEFPEEVKEALQKAAEYYEANLDIVRELGDRAAQGRACGNLGNTHYLLGNFSQAIVYHEERLAIAKEFGDKSAERRAYSNLGNAHIFLGEFPVAAEHYKRTLQLARELGDRALEAQACYSLGNTYTLLRDYDKAIEFHIQHLTIAQELNDRVGEGRACWSLGNAHTALGHHEQALKYASKHLDISKEIGDATGQVTAQMNLTDLRTLLGISDGSCRDVDNDSINTDQSSTADEGKDESDAGPKRASRARRLSMENMEIMKLTPDKLAEKRAAAGAKSKTPRVQKAASVATDLPQQLQERTLPGQRPHPTVQEKEAPKKITPDMIDDDSFFDLLSKFQSRRIDDQRCSFRVLDPSAPRRASEQANGAIGGMVGAAQEDAFLDMVAGIQGSRMNDQRAALPKFPGLKDSDAVLGPLLQEKEHAPDDQFLEMLMKCQGSRIDDQRSTLPERSAPTVPDEDFFSLINRLQSNRLDEQRTMMPENIKQRPVLVKKKKEKKEK